MIVPVGKGKYVVKSSKGKNLSKPVSKAQAEKRLAQVEHFKKMGKSKRGSASEMIARGTAEHRFV